MGYAAKDTVSAPKETAATGFISIKRVADAFRSAAKWFESQHTKSASDTATAPVAQLQKNLDTVIPLLGTGAARNAVSALKSENKRIEETINGIN
jgi:hypothetical protein